MTNLFRHDRDFDEMVTGGYFTAGIPALIELHTDGRTAILRQDIVFIDGSGVEWRAEAGLRFDGGSVPRAVWSLSGVTPFTSRARTAFILHDAYYQRHRGRTKQEVEHMFWDCMHACGVPRPRRVAIYESVATFGDKAWRAGE